VLQCGELCHGRAGDNHFQASLSQVSARPWPRRPFGRTAASSMIGPRHLSSVSLLAHFLHLNTTIPQDQIVKIWQILELDRVLEADSNWLGFPAYSPTH
jgi:hypothetical protein